MNALDRFYAKVDRSGTCWLWTATTTHGYGYFYFDGRQVRAHRFAYELLVGPIPEGLELDHLCRVRNCVRPDHLEPVTRRVNMLRGHTIIAEQSRRTRCPQGHAYSGRNNRGERVCHACERDRKRRSRQDAQP